MPEVASELRPMFTLTPSHSSCKNALASTFPDGVSFVAAGWPRYTGLIRRSMRLRTSHFSMVRVTVQAVGLPPHAKGCWS